MCQVNGSNKPNGLLLLGENVDAFDFMAPKYAEAVKCIYMDPPYRNGESYSHYIDTSTHDEWMSSMAAVVPKAWRLLAEDGSLWISIDDSEMAYLKVLLDRCLGSECYVATIVWQHRTTRENRAAFSHNHEYILVYSKNPTLFRRSRNKVHSEALVARYKNPDNDPRGPWQSVTATAQAGHAVSSQFYSIVSPLTGKESRPPKGRCWVYSQERMLEEIRKGNIWFGKDGNGAPRIKKFLRPESVALVPETLWLADEVGTATGAKKHLMSLLPEPESFEMPKPEELLLRILEIATCEGDLVLDPYLGSGTTAAVAHKAGRRYIGIDRSPMSMSFAERRLDMVVSGMDTGGISKAVCWNGGGSFEAIRLSDCVQMGDALPEV